MGGESYLWHPPSDLPPNALSPKTTIEMTHLPHWVIHLLKVLFGRNSAYCKSSKCPWRCHNRPNQLPHIALLITYIQAQTQTCPWRPWGMYISPSHTTHTLSVLSSSGIYRILIIMELETDKTYAHVMELSAEVLHLYLKQANLTTSGNKRALVERMLDNTIIRYNAPFQGGKWQEPSRAYWYTVRG